MRPWLGAACLATCVALAVAAGIRADGSPDGRRMSPTDRSEVRAPVAPYASARVVEVDSAGLRAFLDVVRVLKSPRCQNCHPAGDAPLQTDAGIPHAMLVTRGPEGRGVTAMKCSNCHGRRNAPGPHRPPGAPNWHLPPPETPMVFEGRSPGRICALMKDPAQNGGKSLEQLVEHLTADSLVLWGWDPGQGRTLPPLSQPEFAARVETWAESGFPCPEG